MLKNEPHLFKFPQISAFQNRMKRVITLVMYHDRRGTTEKWHVANTHHQLEVACKRPAQEPTAHNKMKFNVNHRKFRAVLQDTHEACNNKQKTAQHLIKFQLIQLSLNQLHFISVGPTVDNVHINIIKQKF